MSPDTEGDLSEARARAEQLRSRLAMVRARADWTNERLAYVRDQLAVASTRSVLAEQQLAVLQAADADANATLAHRVRAIEQSGGAMALYTQAIDGSSLTDIASNIAALNAVLGTDAAAVSASGAAEAQADNLYQRLDVVADQRAALVKRADALADQARRLLVAQRYLLRTATDDVLHLARELAKEREAAAKAAAAAARRAAARAAGDVQPGAVDADANPYAEAAIKAALSKLGADYVWGAEGPDTFDCSGLVQWAYGQAGLLMPRLASDQYFASAPVAVSAMKPGDVLVYAYDPSDESTIHHIAMYIGNGHMVHAPRTGDVVRVVPVYYDGLYGVGRPGG